jgi:hypothetical protein
MENSLLNYSRDPIFMLLRNFLCFDVCYQVSIVKGIVQNSNLNSIQITS